MSKTYQNPIMRGMYPDPSIVQVDGTYYLVNSTFEYYPGIAVSKSKDLVNWTRMQGIAIYPEQADLRQAKSNEGIFAVNIRYHDGFFYVITTNFSEFKTIIIKGQLNKDQEEIEWEPNRVEVEIRGIDPDLYFENDRTYVQFTGYIDDQGTKAIQQVEIDLTTGDLVTEPKVLTKGTGGRDVEGPHIIKRGDWYYLLIAEGGTGLGHMITMQRSHELWGPYEAPLEVNPIFTNRDRAEEPLQNIGHADLFQDPKGNWWMTCLGTRPSAVEFIKITNTGRETLLYPVDWSEDWPKVYHGVPTQEVDLTDFYNHAETIGEQKIMPFVDEFSNDKLGAEWLTLRDSLGDRLNISKGKLSLTGSDRTIEKLGTPSFLGVRQSEPKEALEITVDIKDTKLNQGQAGIVSLINADHYAALMIQYNAEKSEYEILKVLKVADIEQSEVVGTSKDLPHQLILKNDLASKRFSAVWSDREIYFDISSLHLSNEAIAALNTGDMEGIYVLNDAELTITKVERK
ncbi:glycoside hydrolase family 43 protein [Xylocopilactobacillus apis]|uniref:Xylosidase/arabinosidase n=1 Tax=Xylocopilactobacillus apis TaxID=2932183 RepID=A0AAU9DLZ4_9LACO|nr:glycoside hydrolase family 43 protein [Xylocopilactobacillus apis]BDR56629.1 xylosidase/arabinosidase [Xylocopilactobacillus apis]